MSKLKLFSLCVALFISSSRSIYLTFPAENSGSGASASSNASAYTNSYGQSVAFADAHSSANNNVVPVAMPMPAPMMETNSYASDNMFSKGYLSLDDMAMMGLSMHDINGLNNNSVMPAPVVNSHHSENLAVVGNTYGKPDAPWDYEPIVNTVVSPVIDQQSLDHALSVIHPEAVQHVMPTKDVQLTAPPMYPMPVVPVPVQAVPMAPLPVQPLPVQAPVQQMQYIPEPVEEEPQIINVKVNLPHHFFSQMFRPAPAPVHIIKKVYPRQGYKHRRHSYCSDCQKGHRNKGHY